MDLSVKSIKENWNKKSTAQKVGTVAAGVAGAAAVASVVVAGIKGKKIVTDDFVKGLELKNGENVIEKASDLKFFKKVGLIFGEGYKAIGKGIAGAWGKVTEAATGLFNKIFKKGEAPAAEATAAPAAEIVEEVVEAVTQG